MILRLKSTRSSDVKRKTNKIGTGIWQAVYQLNIQDVKYSQQFEQLYDGDILNVPMQQRVS